MIAVVDTSVILALLNPKDQHHQRCLAVYRQQRTIFLPQSVLAEAGWMLGSRANNRLAAQFLRAFAQNNSKFTVTGLEIEDRLRTTDILDKYADSRIDFVDASVSAVAERLDVCRILTLDRRDFGMVRPRHCDALELLPEVQP